MQHVPRVQNKQPEKRKVHWKDVQKDLDKKRQKLAEGKDKKQGKDVK